MESVSSADVERALVENAYHFLPAVTEHVFELCRGETSRFTIHIVRRQRVKSASHFVANMIAARVCFQIYPPTAEEVAEVLKPYQFNTLSGPHLLATFEDIVAGHRQHFEELEEVLLRFGPILWAVQLLDDWNARSGVCCTHKEFIHLDWFTTA